MALAITTVSLPAGEVGVAYSTTLASSGGVAPITWTLTAGSLPNGLSLAGSTGVISGTPTTPVSATPLTFHAVDSTPVTPQTADSSGLTLTVDAAIAVTTSSLSPAQVGVAYSVTLAASGGVAPLTWSVSAGILPTGLSLNASTGVISGTPVAIQPSASITFLATDSATPTPGTASSSGLTFTVNAAAIIQPVGAGNTSLTFPLMPLAWPLTVIPGSDPASAQVPPLQVPQMEDVNNTAQQKVISTAMKQAQYVGSRVV